MTSGTMLRALLSGLVLATATSQLSNATFTPLPSTSPRCCDATTLECQTLIRQCFANTNSTATGSSSCYSLACPTPLPSVSPMQGTPSQCCDPATLTCQDAIKVCIGAGNPSSVCQALACPTPTATLTPLPSRSSAPSPIQCCDPTRMQCTGTTFLCPSAMPSPSASFTIRPSPIDTFTPSASVTAYPTKRVIDPPSTSPIPTIKQCCDPATQICQDMIKECIAQGAPAILCQTLACTNSSLPASPQPTSCCDPANLECMTAVKRCFDSGSPQSVCQAMICPTPQPTVPQMPPCCDPVKPECQVMIRECLASGAPADMCNMLICPTLTPVPIKPTESMFPSRPPFPSRSAQPTMLIKPLFSALPTRPPARTRLPANFTLPDRLPATISFPRANVTELIRPAKLQEIQASIACAIRMPLENIEIKNITIRRALTGVEEPVKVDLSVARLQSNGTVQCLVVGTSAPAQRRLRRHLQTTEDSVNVQYDIIAPTEDAMITDLNTALTGDATMNAIASSVGSTSIVATTGQTQQQPQQIASSSSSSSINNVGVIIGSVGGLIAVIAVSALIVQTQRSRRNTVSATTRMSHAPSVIMVTQENPISHPANVTQSQRVVFTPYGARV